MEILFEGAFTNIRGGIFMKKVLGLVIFILLIGLAGCSSSNGNSKSTSGGKEVISLTASVEHPPGIPYSDGFAGFLEEIEKRSEGRVKFEIFYSGSLSPAEDVINSIANGVIDIAPVQPTAQSGKMSLETVANNPATYEDVWVAMKSMNELYETIPNFKENWDQIGIKKIGVFVTPRAIIHSTKPLNDFDDLKGLRVLTVGKPQALVAQELGMTPVGMPVTDTYEAMSKGTVDAVFINFSGANALRFEEVIKSIWTLPVAGNGGIYAMNANVWDRLPEDIQKIIEEVDKEYNAEYLHELYNEIDKKNEKGFIEKGINIKVATKEEIEKLSELTKGVGDVWVKEQEDRKLPGREVLNTFNELTDKYSTQNPYTN